MTIYEALKKDHRTVEGLLNQLVALTQDNIEKRHELIETIRDELVPHSRAEEAVLYNSMRTLDTASGLVMHSYQEHLEAETLLRMLQVRDKIDVEWKETAMNLKKALMHHISEEETKVFAAAKEIFTTEEAEMMCDAFEKLKPGIKKEGLMTTTLELVVNLMPPRLSSVFKKNNLETRI